MVTTSITVTTMASGVVAAMTSGMIATVTSGVVATVTSGVLASVTSCMIASLVLHDMVFIFLKLSSRDIRLIHVILFQTK